MTVRCAPWLVKAFAAAMLVSTTGCFSSRPVDRADYTQARPETGTPAEITGVAGLGTPELDAKNERGATGMGVNEYLWRGALETLSFLPLASADPFGGVIITDWYQPPAAPGERFKATAYILGRQLRADGIRIAVFRQTMQDGRWVDADVAPNTVSEIEDKVLARARELRARAAG